MKLRTLMTTASAALMLAAAPAAAQMYEGWDSNAGYDGFHSGMMDSGRYNALDRDKSGSLSEGEFATGMFADWDNDDEFGINEAEFDMGAQRWYGDDYDRTFADYDADGSGLIDQNEFGANWDNTYYQSWDGDGNNELSDREYTEGVYNTADVNQDKVITVEEEGWFEGWFDGDDVEAEIEEVGDVM